MIRIDPNRSTDATTNAISLCKKPVEVIAVTSVSSGDGIERHFTMSSHTSQEILDDFNNDSTFRDIFASMSLDRMKSNAMSKMPSTLCVFCGSSPAKLTVINKAAETTHREIRICLWGQFVCNHKNCQFLHRIKEIASSQEEQPLQGDDAVAPASLSFLTFPQKLMMYILQHSMGPTCGWSHNGKVYSISNRIMFSMTTLPILFPDMCYNDFVINLKDWGFQVSLFAQGLDFSHALFQRDCPELCFDIIKDQQQELQHTNKKDQEGDQVTRMVLPAQEQDSTLCQAVASSSLPSADVPSFVRPTQPSPFTDDPSQQFAEFSTSRGTKTPQSSIFFDALRTVLNDEKTNDIITWAVHDDNTIWIRDAPLLVNHISPIYFPHLPIQDWKTFEALLLSHRFKSIGQRMYWHPWFQKDKKKNSIDYKSTAKSAIEVADAGSDAATSSSTTKSTLKKPVAKSSRKRKHAQPSPSRKPQTRRQPRFPDALFLALQDRSIEDVIGWTDDGQSVWVKDKDRLVAEVYPKHFAWMSKMQDFYNGLCNYNFKAESRGTGKYSNPDFRRDSPGLIVRSKNASTTKRRALEHKRKRMLQKTATTTRRGTTMPNALLQIM